MKLSEKLLSLCKNEALDSASVAKQILAQLGGNKFIMMTGAKSLSHGDDGSPYLSFRIGKNKSSANIVKISLNAKDLYDVKFMKVSGSSLKTVDEKNDLYSDMLASTFTDVTGLYTSLGTMGKQSEANVLETGFVSDLTPEEAAKCDCSKEHDKKCSCNKSGYGGVVVFKDDTEDEASETMPDQDTDESLSKRLTKVVEAYLTPTANQLKRTSDDWSKVAGEKIETEFIKGTIYGYGSEAGVNKIEKNYNKSGHFLKNIRTGYSENLKTNFFALDLDKNEGFGKQGGYVVAAKYELSDGSVIEIRGGDEDSFGTMNYSVWHNGDKISSHGSNFQDAVYDLKKYTLPELKLHIKKELKKNESVSEGETKYAVNEGDLVGKLLALACKDQGIDKKEMLKIWETPKPHFGGMAPHRYQAKMSDYIKIGKSDNDEKVCVYCLKPESFKKLAF